MSQFNLDTPINPATKSGIQLASDLSNWRDALDSSHSGSIRPSYAKPGTIWLNTGLTPWRLNLYDGDSDIILGTIDPTGDKFLPSSSPWTAFTSIKKAATTSSTGVVEMTTGPEALAGTDNQRAITPSSLASGLDFDVTDSTVKLPGGLILNWGEGYVGRETASRVNYRTYFPNNTLSITSVPIGTTSGGGTHDYWGVNGLDAFGFYQVNYYDAAYNFYYIALGY